MERLDLRAVDRISGPSWDKLRGHFESIHNAIIGVSPAVWGELTTIYVKYSVREDIHTEPFAVLWVKTSKQLVLGLALPDSFESPALGETPPRHNYFGLTKYLIVTPEDSVPGDLAEWARAAFDHVQARRSR